MITLKEIYWLAGLLEGEGSFCVLQDQPVIKLSMTDRDTVEKARKIMQSAGSIGNICTYSSGMKNDGSIRKEAYYFRAVCRPAISWMMTIYPLMSDRRQWQIAIAIQNWKRERIRKKGSGIYGRKNLEYWVRYGLELAKEVQLAS